MEDKEIMQELIKEKQIEKQTFELSKQDYLKGPSENEKLFSRKLQLQKEMLEIDNHLNKTDPQLKQKKMIILRRNVLRHMREKQLSQNQIDLYSNNNKFQARNPSGI